MMIRAATAVLLALLVAAGFIVLGSVLEAHAEGDYIGGPPLRLSEGAGLSLCWPFELRVSDSQFDLACSGGIGTVTLNSSVTQLGATLEENELPSSSVFYSSTAHSYTAGAAAKTLDFDALTFTNDATSSTASKVKTGLKIASTGTWNGTTAINRGLSISATGGTTNTCLYCPDAPIQMATATLAGSGNYLKVNALGNASTTLLNGGVLLYDGAGLNYGIDLGYNGSYRTRVFAPNAGTVTIAGSGTTPTSQSAFTDVFYFDLQNARLGIGVSSTGDSLSLSGQAAVVIGPERNTTSNTAGNSVTLHGSGATSGATDKAGGALVLAPGKSTGLPATGVTAVKIQGYTTAASTGTSDNAAVDRAAWPSPKIVADATSTGLFEISLATLKMCSGSVDWAVRATNGTDMQARAGRTVFSAVNKGGTYSLSISCDSQTKVDSATDATCTAGTGSSVALSTGTLAVAPHVVSGTNKITFQVNADTSLTPSTGYPEVTYAVTINCPETITVL